MSRDDAAQRSHGIRRSPLTEVIPNGAGRDVYAFTCR